MPFVERHHGYVVRALDFDPEGRWLVASCNPASLMTEKLSLLAQQLMGIDMNSGCFKGSQRRGLYTLLQTGPRCILLAI